MDHELIMIHKIVELNKQVEHFLNQYHYFDINNSQRATDAFETAMLTLTERDLLFSELDLSSPRIIKEISEINGNEIAKYYYKPEDGTELKFLCGSSSKTPEPLNLKITWSLKNE